MLSLGIDLGTTYLKAAVHDAAGRSRGLGRVRVRPDTSAGRCEWPVTSFWEAFRDAVRDALRQAGAAAGDVATAACASQANSFVLVDARDLAPTTPLILWPDGRAGEPPDAVRRLWQRPDFLAETGLGVDATSRFAVSKWAWWRDTAPAEWSRLRPLTLPDYVACALTGRPAVDAGTAALLGLLKQSSVAWWPDALSALGLDAARLPPPVRPGTLIGTVTPAGAACSGLAEGTCLAAGGLDHQAAAIGAGIGDGDTGRLSVSLGTVLAVVGRGNGFHPARGVCCLPGRSPDEHFRLAFDGRGGGLIEAYRTRHGLESLAPSALDALAAAVAPDADGVELVWPATDGGLAFRNLQPHHGHGHAMRAILNASAIALGELVGRILPGGRPGQLVAVGGGSASSLWRDVLSASVGCAVVPSECTEPAAAGAALLARGLSSR